MFEKNSETTTNHINNHEVNYIEWSEVHDVVLIINSKMDLMNSQMKHFLFECFLNFRALFL